MDKTTFFSSALPCKPLKKLGCYILDFFVALILCIAIFSISEAIGNNISSMKSLQSEIQDVYKGMTSIASSSKLMVTDENGYFLSQSEIANRYVYGITYSSLKKNDEQSLSDSIYDGYTSMNEETDYCFYYNVTFKEEHKSNFIGFDIESDKYVELLSSYTSSLYYEIDLDYPYLNLDTSKKLDEYFRNENYSIGKDIYSNIYDGYLKILNESINELENKYYPYISLKKEYNELTLSIYRIKYVELFISYTIAVLICYLIIPVILKDGRTISFRVFKLGVTDNKDNRLSWYNYLLKTIITLLGSIPIMAITILIFFGSSSGFDFIIQGLIGNISLLSLSLFMLIEYSVSYAICFAFKNSHQSIAELFSFEIVKDSKEFKAITNKEIK